MINFLAIIQARSGSTRLPNKCLKVMPNGLTLVEHVYAITSRCVPQAIVAVPKGDAPIIDLLASKNIPCFCGAENDVLDRYYQCAKTFGAQFIGRITADCYAMLDAEIFYMTNVALQGRFDFSSNTFKPKTCYEGTDYEIMSFRCLEWLYKNTSNPKYREHVSNYIYENMDAFGKTNMSVWNRRWPLNLSDIKTSIDTEEEFAKAQKQGVWK
jgi:spore coat polysaccharide biosynthesis protein SpsF